MLNPVRIIVSNTTPLIALASINQIDVLQQLYGEIVIPPAVEAELVAGSDKIAVPIGTISWIRTVALQDERRASLIVGLDRGEAEVLALAQELRAELVLIDERLARRYARRAGLLLSGTLGVLVKAKQQGIIAAVAPLTQALREHGMYLSEVVVAEALRLAGEG
jgi:hypothetical protein